MDNSFVVTVMDVHQGNLMEIWPALVCSIRNASFIGMDCELSGLGRRNLINTQSVEERYKNISEVARTRSIISIGLSCFKAAKGSAQGEPFHCDVQTFNLMTLCTEDYVVEPPALQFLVNHGFDFHKQYSSGIPYYRGCDKEEGRPKKKKTWDLRDIFSVLVASKVPLVVHNGLVDLIFLYGSLYADLPAALPTFVADLEQMFPAGIYDSKYIAEFSLRTSASFLEFVFRRQQIRNLSARGGKAVTLTHSLAVSAFVDAWDCSARLQCDQQTPICSPYSSHGFCPEGTKCGKSHDVVRAVIQEEQKKGRKRKLQEDGGPILDGLKSGIDSALQQPTSERFKGHRAGHDAFMTAFCFATFVAGRLSQDGDVEERIRKAADSVRNRICLSGKDFPFLIQKSAFSKCSKAHTDKLKRILEQEEAS